MQVLKEIIKRSNYKPQGGLKGELYNLVNHKNYDEQKIKKYFYQIGKLKQLHSVNRNLKESLLESILTISLHSYRKAIRNRIKVLKRQLQVRILIYTGSKIAGVKLAIDTIVTAEKNQDFETVHVLCRELIMEFSIGQIDNLRYRKYRKKMEMAWQYLNEELTAEKTYRDLIHCYNIRGSLENFIKRIKQLDEIEKKNIHFKFNFFYYSTKSLYFQLIDEKQFLIKNNQKAYKFFEKLNLDLHYAIKFQFLSDLIPYYIIERQFGLAHSTILNCQEMPPRGSYNWHKILIYKTVSGFYSNKPGISLSAFKTSKSIAKKFDNPTINEKWHLIKGYLALYHKAKRVHYDENFRLSKFLNIEETQKNNAQKANLIILELLHLLADGKRMLFFKKLERVEAYISNRFRAHAYKRTRYFLRALKSVVKGNYHSVLTNAHAEKQLKKLKATKNELGGEALDLEIVPYEILWEIVQVFLRK